jgi:hypothetical protein
MWTPTEGAVYDVSRETGDELWVATEVPDTAGRSTHEVATEQVWYETLDGDERRSQYVDKLKSRKWSKEADAPELVGASFTDVVTEDEYERYCERADNTSFWGYVASDEGVSAALIRAAVNRHSYEKSDNPRSRRGRRRF